MKKNIAIILLGSMMLSMTGCSAEAINNTSVETGIVAEEATDTAVTNVATEEETTDAGETATEDEGETDSEQTSVMENTDKETDGMVKAVTSKRKTSAQKKEKEETTAKGEEATLSDDILDFTFSVNGDVIKVPCWYEEMEKMGWEYDGDATEKVASDGYACSYFVKDNVILETVLYNPSINAVAAKNCEIEKLTFYPEYASDNDQANAEVVLPNNIKVFESTKKDIIKAYGEPSTINNTSYADWLTYTKEDCISEVQLWVNKETGKLDTVEIHNKQAFDLGEEEVSNEKPESIDKYKAPKKVSADPFDYTCEFGGDLYTFPCPVTAFIDNGWEISEDHIGDSVGGGATGYTMLSRGNKEIFIYLRNYEDIALPVEYGYVQCIETDDLKTSESMTISGKITIGSKESTINNLFKKYDCTVDKNEYDFATCYHIEDSDCNGYFIYVNDGKVTGIELQKYTYEKTF